MSDPLLSTLCSICHTNPPKYTCPRCSLRTCSLPCTTRHKLRASCTGIRDPTVYVPRHRLATPAGVDHDYNFLAGIERGVERAEAEVVGKRGLLKAVGMRRREEERAERERARGGVNGFVGRGGRGGGRGRGGERLQRGDAQLAKGLESSGVIIDRAPTGMQRRVENSTSWNKAQKCVAWQVEWMRMGDEGRVDRVLAKVPENKVLGGAFAEVLEEERLAALGEVERRAEKKRKAEAGATERARWKRARMEGGRMGVETTAFMQDATSGAWCADVDVAAPPLASSMDGDVLTMGVRDDSSTAREVPGTSPDYTFYLLRPHTPSSHPHVLIPLSATATLAASLRHRVVLEYPTIYALAHAPDDLPAGLTTEARYLANTKRGAAGLVNYDSGSEEEDEMEVDVEGTASHGSDVSSSSEEGDSDDDTEEQAGDAMDGVEGAERMGASDTSSSGESEDLEDEGSR